MSTRSIVLGAALFVAMSVAAPATGQTPAVVAEPTSQETSPSNSPSWAITTVVRTGANERVSCTLTFPSSEESPELSVNVIGQRSPLPSLNFELRGVGALATTERASVPDIDLSIGRSTEQPGLEGQWRSNNNGRLSFTSEGSATALINALGRAADMTVTIGEKVYQYDLSGSLRAVYEFNKCLA